MFDKKKRRKDDIEDEINKEFQYLMSSGFRNFFKLLTEIQKSKKIQEFRINSPSQGFTIKIDLPKDFVRSQDIEMFDLGNSLKIVIKLPDITEEDLSLIIKENQLLISIPKKNYRRRILLPCKVKKIVPSYKRDRVEIELHK